MTMSDENVKKVADAIEESGGQIGTTKAVVVGDAIPRAVVAELERRGVKVIHHASAPTCVEPRENSGGILRLEPEAYAKLRALNTQAKRAIPGTARANVRILGPNWKPLTAAGDVEQPTAPRSCGGCSACCSTVGVRALEKGPHERCTHQGPGGCEIHAERPDECRTYRCAWLEGQWGEAERPDRLGVIFDAGDGAARAREVFRGAFDRKRAKDRLLELHRLGVNVRLIPYKGRKLPTGVAL